MTSIFVKKVRIFWFILMDAGKPDFIAHFHRCKYDLLKKQVFHEKFKTKIWNIKRQYFVLGEQYYVINSKPRIENARIYSYNFLENKNIYPKERFNVFVSSYSNWYLHFIFGLNVHKLQGQIYCSTKSVFISEQHQSQIKSNLHYTRWKPPKHVTCWCGPSPSYCALTIQHFLKKCWGGYKPLATLRLFHHPGIGPQIFHFKSERVSV